MGVPATVRVVCRGNEIRISYSQVRNRGPRLVPAQFGIWERNGINYTNCRQDADANRTSIHLGEGVRGGYTERESRGSCAKPHATLQACIPSSVVSIDTLGDIEMPNTQAMGEPVVVH